MKTISLKFRLPLFVAVVCCLSVPVRATAAVMGGTGAGICSEFVTGGGEKNESRPSGREGAVRPDRMRCEYLENPEAVDVPSPRLSWIVRTDSTVYGQCQSGWQVQVASSEELLRRGRADRWDSGRVGGDSMRVRYGGKPLRSRDACWWRVRVWDAGGRPSAWSAPAHWHMGLLGEADWQAQWIGAPEQGDGPLSPDGTEPPLPAPLLRKSFGVAPGRKVVSARVYVTGLGYFELYLNGEKVGRDVLAPNQTNYDKRPGLADCGIPVEDNFREYTVPYLAYDVTERLRSGENVIGAMLGNGFYNVRGRWTMAYGSPRLIAQLEIVYDDGSQERVVSDPTWKVAEGPVRMDQIYAGEEYDARCEQPGWCAPGFDDSAWQNAVPRRAPYGRLRAQNGPADRVMEVLKPVKFEKLGGGRYRVDFGETVSGWVRLHGVRGEAGRRIEIKYLSESPNGSNAYTMKGEGPEDYVTRFTWYVFREVELSGWPGELHPGQLTAEAVYSDVETTGGFACSNPLLNRIDRIWWRTQLDNMHGAVASDCPHRERSAYTGDGQTVCATVMHRFDAAAFYSKWIGDILAAQNPDTGYVPNGAPWQPGCGGGVAWGAAICIMPWEFYLHYGDRDMLARNLDGMKGYVDYLDGWADADGVIYARAPHGREPVYWMNLGDWCPPGKLPSDTLVHTFYYWRCADIAARTARVLGDSAGAQRYGALAERVRRAFHGRFYDPGTGSYGPFGGDVFALYMGVPPERYPRVCAALRDNIRRNGGHLDTGIYGTQFLLEVLCDNGMNDLAYGIMTKRTFPSFGHWIEQGATTMWEQWDGGNSHCHPMFGACLTWLYRRVAGMESDPERPGYRHIVFRPRPVGDLTWARYAQLTSRGEASVRWERTAGGFMLEADIPAGSTATVWVPLGDGQTRADVRLSHPAGVSFVRVDETAEVRPGNSGISGDRFHRYAVYEVKGSGRYRFTSGAGITD